MFLYRAFVLNSSGQNDPAVVYRRAFVGTFSPVHFILNSLYIQFSENYTNNSIQI